MFEDSTFESMGRIHTRSRGWMIATLAFNSSILLALILIPLMYPAALPQIVNSILMTVPPAVEEARPVTRPQHAQTSASEIKAGVLQAPPKISDKIWIPSTQEEPAPINVAALGGDGGSPTGPGSPMGGGHSAHPDVRQAVRSVTRVSKGVMEGMLVRRVDPVYPAIARAIRLSGTVVLEATISRAGTIENLRAASGPPLLQQAALDAVKQWRYRPYLLNGEPVEVETTVNVEFKMD